MHEKPKDKFSLIDVNSSLRDTSTQRLSSFSIFLEKVHSINGLHLLCAMFQLFLGIFLVALSLLNLIEPIWIASILAVIGSIAIITGFYFLFYILNRSNTFDSLLNKAIKRVINAQN
jgi:DNA integrity scanning protein DisA with diadenylate cyclase activity